MRRLPLVMLMLPLCAAARQQLESGNRTCAERVSDGRKVQLLDYVRSKYALPSSISLTLINDQALEGSCYRQLTFEGKSPIRTWQLKLYLSPDRRFLTSDLLDTMVDPVQERRRRLQLRSQGQQQIGDPPAGRIPLQWPSWSSRTLSAHIAKNSRRS